MQVGEIPAGGWNVRLHVHVSFNVHRQMFGHLSASALLASEKRSNLCHIVMVAEFDLQHPADVHLLPQRGWLGRVRSVRLLGRLCEALGGQSLHHMDQSHHLHHPSGHPEHLLRADQLQNMAKFQTENQTGAVH